MKHDLTNPIESNEQYDLVVSNLVFHNIGKKRFKAYGAVFDVLKPAGFFVIGDLFPQQKADMDYFREHSTLINGFKLGGQGPWTYKILILKKPS